LATKTQNSFSGRWRINWMSSWDQDYVDMEVPGHITFVSGRSGSFQFGLVQAQIDCRINAATDPPLIEFTWHGFDEGDELTGRGYAELVNGELKGHLYVHVGDDSAFRAVRQTVPARKRKRT
jgi:hypothetical protein